MTRFSALAFGVFLATAATANAAAWLQLGPGGAIEARATAAGQSCPSASVDGFPAEMAVRAKADASFPMICALNVPTTAKTLAIGGQSMALPVADPRRILVLGDTGCRIKGAALQACNDPKAWPFAGLAKAAAALKPDLVLHLGDYLYRESPCPADFAGCAGSPYGDNWASWDADFFAPAAPLLAAAPWVVIRGNHEDCQRAGPGFLRLLGPGPYDPAAPCNPHLDPYGVQAGAQTIAVMDSASAADRPVDEAAVPVYAKDFDALKAMANIGTGRELWLASHRPIWAAISVAGMPVGGNATMIEAAGDLSTFAAISLMLAGHIHSFEAIDYTANIPPQIVAGHGGDNLDLTPADLRGTVFQGNSGVHVTSGLSVGGFGFLMLTRDKQDTGWTIQLYDSDGNPIRQCLYRDRAIACPAPN